MTNSVSARRMMNVNEQMDVFRRGVDSIEPEEELAKRLEEDRPLRLKLGVDPTSADLHLGHMVSIQKLRALQDLGHEVVFVIGSYTARIGDPAGRNKLRPPLAPEQVDANAATYRAQVFRVLDEQKTRVVDNGDWLGKLTFEDLLRLCAKVTVARTLERDDFSKRYHAHQPIFLHEFLYPVMQGYDSVVLQPDVEIGGTDQRFNILAARDIMIQFGQRPQIGLFVSLLPGLDGVQKMSKSASNAVGIAELPLDMISKILSISDDAMRTWWPLVTLQTPAKVATILQQLGANELHPKDAKKMLALCIVAQYHGVVAGREAMHEWERLHEARGSGAAPEDAEILVVAAASLTAIDLCADAVFTTVKAGKKEPMSRSALRRLIEQKGIYLNDVALDNPDAQLTLKDGDILRVSRKQYRRIIIDEGDV